MSICLQRSIRHPKNPLKLSRHFLAFFSVETLVTSGLQAIDSRQMVCGIKESLCVLGNGYAIQQGDDV